MANNPMWTKQMNNNTIQTQFLSYVTVKERINVSMNSVSSEVPTHVPHMNETNNTYTP